MQIEINEMNALLGKALSGVEPKVKSVTDYQPIK